MPFGCFLWLLDRHVANLEAVKEAEGEGRGGKPGSKSSIPSP